MISILDVMTERDRMKDANEILTDAINQMLECTGGSENWNGETRRCLALMESALVEAKELEA